MGETLKQNEQQNVVNEKIADNMSFETTTKAIEEMEMVDNLIKNVEAIKSENEAVEKDFDKLLEKPGIPPVGEWFDHIVSGITSAAKTTVEFAGKMGDVTYKLVKKGVKEMTEFWSENAYKLGGPVYNVVTPEEIKHLAETTTKGIVDAYKAMGYYISGKNEESILDSVINVFSNSINRVKDASTTLKLIKKLNEIKDTFEGMTYTEMKNHPSYNDAVKFLKASFSIKFYGEVRDVSIEEIQSKLGVDADGKFGPKTLAALIDYLKKFQK